MLLLRPMHMEHNFTGNVGDDALHECSSYCMLIYWR